MTLQSRAEMTYHEKIVVDFAKYYDEIISEEKREELEANFEKEDLTDEESDEIYKNMFQTYMDELYSLVKKRTRVYLQECINSQPNAIITIARRHVDENGYRVSGLLP